MPFERLGRASPPSPEAELESLVQARLKAWIKALSPDDDPHELYKFLDWEGLDLASASQALRPLDEQETPWPDWAELLDEALKLSVSRLTESRLTESSSQLLGSQLPGRPPQPFEELLRPFVCVCWRRLADQAGASLACLAAEARLALEQDLLERLSSLAAQALYVEFNALRMEYLALHPDALEARAQAPGRELYEHFIQSMQAGGLVAFFTRYPVLARLLAIQAQVWVEAQAEFLRRLAADRRDIEGVFGQKALGAVLALQAGLSDPHRGGRSAISLRFESGLRLVYKPKDLGIELAYNQLLTWVNRRCAQESPGQPPALRALRVLNRASHGWVEYAQHSPCADEAALLRYYRRAGMLLCLVYVLDGSDCHAENLVASGEYPILVDNETLLRQRASMTIPLEIRAGAQFQAVQRLNQSVLYTGLLPNWRMGQEQRLAYDISGLGHNADQAVPYRVPTWLHVNSDLMTLTFQPAPSSATANIPCLKSGDRMLEMPLNSGRVDAVVEGFQHMYRFGLAHRQELLAAGGPLETFRTQKVRFVFRDSQIYALIQKQAQHPKYLCDGADYGLYLERLARAHLTPDSKPPGWPVLAAERRAMYRLDIPFFTAQVNQTGLILESGETIPGYFAAPSFDHLVERVNGLGESDLAWQTELVRLSLHTWQAAGDGRGWETKDEGRRTKDEPPVSGETPQALVAEAFDLARTLEARAIWGMDGSATWIAPHYLPQADRFQVSPLTPGLYDGLPGVALFLAALERVKASMPADGECAYRALSLAALRAVRAALQDEEFDRTVSEYGLGGATGLGSLLYSLAQVGRWLDEPALIQEAHAAANRLRPEHIAADTAFDVLSGAAGAILGLLAVYAVRPDDAVLQRAAECARHVLAKRVASQTGLRAWPGQGGQLLTGFSHGAAGIAYALARLYAVTGECDFRAAAEEAIAYETSLRVEGEGNWPDLRLAEGMSPGPPRFKVQWCHGAPGIGLARLGGLAVLDTPAIRRDIEIALATTQQALADRQPDRDHVCCGAMGRLELLLEAGLRLNRPDLSVLACQCAFQVVADAHHNGGYCFTSATPRGVFAPGFFQGAAGIGYQLLRLAAPGQLPSVLLWE